MVYTKKNYIVIDTQEIIIATTHKSYLFILSINKNIYLIEFKL